MFCDEIQNEELVLCIETAKRVRHLKNKGKKKRDALARTKREERKRNENNQEEED